MASSRATSDSLTHLLPPSLLLHVLGTVGVGQRLRDLDDRHGETVAGVHVMRIVWGHEACVCINEAVVDECGVCKHAHLYKVVEHHNECEHGMHCMECGR